MGKNTTIIKIWRGRAYLHQEWPFGYTFIAKDTPLGNNPDLIEKFRDQYDCEIIFLNDDFTEEDQIAKIPLL